jgi:hypothetical protein
MTQEVKKYVLWGHRISRDTKDDLVYSYLASSYRIEDLGDIKTLFENDYDRFKIGEIVYQIQEDENGV